MSITNNDDSQHYYLESFLSTRLPELGLDYETYGPYVLGTDLLDEDEKYKRYQEEELQRQREEAHVQQQERLEQEIIVAKTSTTIVKEKRARKKWMSRNEH